MLLTEFETNLMLNYSGTGTYAILLGPQNALQGGLLMAGVGMYHLSRNTEI